MKKYINRYGAEYIFTKDEEGNVDWQGDFTFCSIGYSNNYDAAYAAYLEVEGNPPHDRTLSKEQFEREVHNYNEIKKEHVYKKYINLITTNKNKLSMTDPSGGPYICLGMDLEFLGKKFKGLVVKEIIPNRGNYKLIV